MMKKNMISLLLALTAVLNYSCLTDQSMTESNVKLKVSANLKVGNATYDDAGATIKVIGYDENSIKKWSDTFKVDSANNEIIAKFGYHHYTIEMEKWGMRDEKTLSAGELWTGRLEGPSPITLTLSVSTALKKPSYYTEFFEVPEVGFKPQQKVKFEYNTDGKLIKKIAYGFDPVDQSLVELNYLKFTYSNNLVTKITGYLTGQNNPHTEFVYEYLPDQNVSSIHETNYAAGINSTVSFLYNTSANKVKATYAFSNGRSFTYDLALHNKNITSDKTINGTNLCNTGQYTYDDGINPLSQLGYIEYELSNYSFNNRLSENVNYVDCAFPSLVPQTYTYVYDDQGYPIVATTVYKSGKRSQRIFIYQ